MSCTEKIIFYEMFVCHLVEKNVTFYKPLHFYPASEFAAVEAAQETFMQIFDAVSTR